MDSKSGREREDEVEELPPEKRQKVNAEQETKPQELAKPESKKSGGGGGHQVLGALKKIGAHIGTLSKFKKASSLLRQLFDQDVLTVELGEETFKVIAASMSDTSRCQDPTLRKEYYRLISSACDHCTLFNNQQRLQLEVYQIWGVLLSEMHTDDNFVFNKVLKKIQEIMELLPEATEVDENAYKDWEALSKVNDEPNCGSSGKEKESVDPFDLDALLDTGGKKKESSTWSPELCLVARREAVVDCLKTAKEKYRFAWACTSVDILLNAAHKYKSRFCLPQQETIDELWRFTKKGKAVRKQGPSAVEIRRDTTSFEQARSEWSKTSVSHRGKVGGGGDHKSEMWLG
ncbi:hypothetical protein BSKO_06980 [Bryopsis sp. KO-2023]|nr:hypothetical protein BSKO_06980 [Bryopsis sp. KO-2023]